MAGWLVEEEDGVSPLVLEQEGDSVMFSCSTPSLTHAVRDT